MPRVVRFTLPAVLIAALALIARAAPAYAANLVQVSSFGSNPGNLAMYSYRPDGLASGAPLVVAMHGCTQNANDYFTNAGWRKYADLWHFALVFPEQRSANNQNTCFNWFEPGDTARGQGEALSIKQMVDYALANYGIDRSRVYVTGLSAGGAMTAVMIAAYPDVFAGGAVIAGLPYRCATSTASAFTCMNPGVDKTPAQWGDLVRAADQGYGGPWPRVTIWHGTGDTTVNPMNATELRDQWTNVLGLSQTPTSTASLPGGTSLEVYGSGQRAVSVYRVSGMPHATPVHPGSAIDQCGATGTYYKDTICSSYYTAREWGLDGGAAPGPSGPAAPTGLTVTAVTASSVSLSWSAVSGAAGYYVYRDGSRVTSSTVTGTSYIDNGLAPGTTYSYTVSAVNSSNVEGPQSAAVSATTSGTAGVCVRASNYAHVSAGRAHQSGGYAYANGSNQNMGLYTTFVTHGLRQTGSNSWVIDDAAC